MNPLQIFYANETEREAVKQFMIDTLGVMAIDKSFAGKPTVGIAEAKECIDKMFADLEATFGEHKKVEIANSR